MFGQGKKKWLVAALGVVLVGGLLFVGAPRAFASSRVGGMMGGGVSNGMWQMMSGNWQSGNPTDAQGTNPNAQGTDAYGWMNSPEMFDAMKNGTMWDYMNSPQVQEQLKNTPMGQFANSPETQQLMQSPEMQNLLKSDAWKNFANSSQFQQMMGQGGVSCHGNSAPGGQAQSQSQSQLPLRGQ